MTLSTSLLEGCLSMNAGSTQVTRDELLLKDLYYIWKDPFSKQDLIHRFWGMGMRTWLFQAHQTTTYTTQQSVGWGLDTSRGGKLPRP